MMIDDKTQSILVSCIFYALSIPIFTCCYDSKSYWGSRFDRDSQLTEQSHSNQLKYNNKSHVYILFCFHSLLVFISFFTFLYYNFGFHNWYRCSFHRLLLAVDYFIIRFTKSYFWFQANNQNVSIAFATLSFHWIDTLSLQHENDGKFWLQFILRHRIAYSFLCLSNERITPTKGKSYTHTSL